MKRMLLVALGATLLLLGAFGIASAHANGEVCTMLRRTLVFTTLLLTVLAMVACAAPAAQPTATLPPQPTTAASTPASTSGGGTIPAPPPAAAVKPPFPLPPSPDVIAAGKAIYMQPDKCVLCHGPNGDGKGIAASGLNPPPRNFTDCTAMKEFPLSTHYDHVVNGVSGTGMSAWKDKLTDEQIWQVVMYERSFCQFYTP